MSELKIDKEYIVKSYSVVDKIKVKEVTEKTYLLKFVDSDYEERITKNEFRLRHYILESL